MCWERACLEKDKGGLGVRDIKTFNKALLGKWKWLMFSQKEALWVKIVDSRYNGWKGPLRVHRVNSKLQNKN